MGEAIFISKEIPTNFITNEVIGKKLEVDDKEYEINCVSIVRKTNF